MRVNKTIHARQPASEVPKHLSRAELWRRLEEAEAANGRLRQELASEQEVSNRREERLNQTIENEVNNIRTENGRLRTDNSTLLMQRQFLEQQLADKIGRMLGLRVAHGDLPADKFAARLDGELGIVKQGISQIVQQAKMQMPATG